MAGNPPPDWYPDPENPAILRWWDGVRWSGETRSAAGAQAGPARGVHIPHPAASEESPPGDDAAGQHASWREPAIESWAAAYRAAEPARPNAAFHFRAWLIGGAVAVVIAGVAAWFLVGLAGH